MYKKLIVDIAKGHKYTDGSIVGSPDFYTTVSTKIKGEFGSYEYRNETVEYNILARIIIHYIKQEIEDLKKQKEKIIKPWYKRLLD